MRTARERDFFNFFITIFFFFFQILITNGLFSIPLCIAGPASPQKKAPTGNVPTFLVTQFAIIHHVEISVSRCCRAFSLCFCLTIFLILFIWLLRQELVLQFDSLKSEINKQLNVFSLQLVVPFLHQLNSNPFESYLPQSFHKIQAYSAPVKCVYSKWLTCKHKMKIQRALYFLFRLRVAFSNLVNDALVYLYLPAISKQNLNLSNLIGLVTILDPGSPACA